MSTASPDQGQAPGRRVLVTGGGGFIGSHLAALLLSRGDSVTIVDNFSTGRRENVDPRATLVEADAARWLADADAEDAFDEIYHLAAAVGVDLVMSEPVRTIESNTALSSAAMSFASRVRPGGAPILIASSSEVYGKPDRDLFSEDDDLVLGPTSVTRWCYAGAKMIDEHLALAYTRQGLAPAVVVRFFNTVGPGQVGSYGMVLPRFVRAALRGEPLRVFGDGLQSRCFCDVRDVVGVLPKLLADPGAAGRVFNVGSDRPITILELAETVIATLGSGSSVELTPYEDAFPIGYEDLRRRRPDLTRIRKQIGFEPGVGLTATIRDIAVRIESETAQHGGTA